MSTTNDELARRFAHHPPQTEERAAAHESVRNAATEVAAFLNGTLPESREKSLALTALQETAMWANTAIALHMEQAEQ